MDKLLNRVRPYLNFFINNLMPRWIIFVIDLGIVAITFVALWWFRKAVAAGTGGLFYHKILLALLIYSISAILFKSYRGVVRFSSFHDIYKLSTTAFVASLFYMVASATLNYIVTDGIVQYNQLWFPIIHGGMVVFAQLIFRAIVKVTFEAFEASSYAKKIKEKSRAFILGLDTETAKIANDILSDNSSKYKPVAFVTIKNGHTSKNVCGLPILHINSNVKELMEQYQVNTMLVTKSQLNSIPKDFFDKCIVEGLELMMVNTISRYTRDKEGQIPPQIKKIKIEDLLGRNVIEMNREAIKDQFEGETILITGAAGSIGSEIARQVVQLNCKKLVLVDQAETPLNDLWLELTGMESQVQIKPIVANVTHKERMRQIFACAQPSLVFHAAAYKHVPMMEFHPSTAVVTNVLGTKICANLANDFNVKRFVMVSTDKAVNPTNVMGATKRAAEIYIQSLSLKHKKEKRENPTQYVTTRFGNVLGSNGSVVPLFKRQIEAGGPVTITHRNITRYFMTIPEACSLVLEAGCTGHGGEIYIFDMGEEVRIYDLAEKMIKLSGKIPGKDIKIVETGLRKGEKLYEELMATEEDTLPTYHPKVRIGKVRTYPYQEIYPPIEELITTALKYDHTHQVVVQLKKLIPEFKSQNSDYEQIDKELELAQKEVIQVNVK
ncbi:MAG: nucleoside-diphosphate sugar epimerase/dehydratase [Bacteroidales bacterium]